MSYAAVVWSHRLGHSLVKKHLRVAQRQILLCTTGAYRTTSLMGLTMATGNPPIDLKIKELANRRQIRKGHLEGTRAEERERMLREWQEEWDNSPHGRYTYGIFPDAEERLTCKVFPDFWTIQILTGHGAFGRYLFGRGKAEHSRCGCGDEDTPEHAVLQCPMTADHRQEIYDAASREKVSQPLCFPDCVRNKEIWKAVSKAWRLMHDQRGV